MKCGRGVVGLVSASCRAAGLSVSISSADTGFGVLSSVDRAEEHSRSAEDTAPSAVANRAWNSAGVGLAGKCDPASLLFLSSEGADVVRLWSCITQTMSPLASPKAESGVVADPCKLSCARHGTTPKLS